MIGGTDMKRFLSLFLSIVLILSSLTLMSSAYWYTTDDKKNGNFYYQDINDSSVAITAYEGEKEVLTIPATLAGKKVVAIGEIFCWHNKDLKEVIIENGIKSIEFNAFAGCENLEKVTIPDSVTKIEGGAFGGCTALSTVVGGKNVTYCDGIIFGGSPFFKDSKNWQNGQFCFGKCLLALDKECSGTFKIKENTTSVSGHLFSNSKNLTSVYIPASVRYFNPVLSASGNFWNCPNLKKITVSKDNKYFSSVNGILFNKKQTVLYRYPSAKSGKTYTVPKNVTKIAPAAFEGSKNLTTVNFDKNSKLYIDAYAFFNCKAIKSMTIPKNVKIYSGEPNIGLYNNGQYNNEPYLGTTYRHVKGFVLKGYRSNPHVRDYVANYLKSSQFVTLCKDGKAHNKTENVKAKKATYFSDGHPAYKRCKVCGEKIGYYRIRKLTLDRPWLKVAGGKGTIKVTYNAVKNATGFQIRYIDQNGNRVTKTFTGNKTKTVKLSGIAKGEYRVYARAFIKSGKQVAYSSWSSRYNVTVK